MTSQTKKFIEFSDIVAVRFRCKSDDCGAELSLPLQAKFSRDHKADKCPNCGSAWLLVPTNGSSGSSIAPSLERVAQCIHDLSKWPGNFEITLEVKLDPNEGEKS